MDDFYYSSQNTHRHILSAEYTLPETLDYRPFPEPQFDSKEIMYIVSVQTFHWIEEEAGNVDVMKCIDEEPLKQITIHLR